MTLHGDNSEQHESVKRRSIEPANEPSTDDARPEAQLIERLLREGAHGFTDAQVLELLVSYAMAQTDATPLVEELLRDFGGLEGVLTASAVELRELAGMRDRATALIRLAGEIARRLSTSEGLRQILGDSDELERYLLVRLRGLREEKLLLIFLNSQGVVLGEEFLGAGTINQVVAFPRQIMEGCLRHGASGLIVVHNHPHGPPLPSLQDREQAEHLREILRPFDIIVKDAIVVGHNRCFSIFRNEPLS